MVMVQRQDKVIQIMKLDGGRVAVSVEGVSLEESIYMLEVAKRELFKINEIGNDISMRRSMKDEN